MNLRWVHAVLILLSAALAVLFGVWCLSAYGRDGGAGRVVAAVVAFAVSAGLVPSRNAENSRKRLPRQVGTLTSSLPPGTSIRRISASAA